MPQPKSRSKSSRIPPAPPKHSRTPPPPLLKRRLPHLVIVLAVLIGATVALTAAGFAVAATQEQRDPFCGSCHTQPESTFLAREAPTGTDLASTHHGKDVRCIDCHSGAGVQGRINAELMGAHNALLWYTGSAVQPAKLTAPIGDENCLKCHAAISQARTMQNHYHYFLPQWQAKDSNAARCTSCHEAHITDGRSDIDWLNQPRTVKVCQACHSKLRDRD